MSCLLCRYAPSPLSPLLYKSQSSRLLPFGVDARILILRLITIFTAYSLAHSRFAVRVRPSVFQRKLQLLPELLLQREKMLSLLLSQLPRLRSSYRPVVCCLWGRGRHASPPLPHRSIFLSLRAVNATCRRRRIRLRDNKSIFR